MLQWIQYQQKCNKKTVTILGVMLVAFFYFIIFFKTVPVFAQTSSTEVSSGASINPGLDVLEGPLGLPTADIRVVIAKIIRVALGFVGLVMLLLIMYGGWLWMSAGGNSEQMDKAKKVIINAAIGLAIMLSAYAIVLFVMKLFGIGNETGLGGLNGTGPQVENFQGSGALGTVIKDHYPARDQKEVPRNTKIIITFRKPLKLDSFIKNTNQSKDKNNKEIFGDCINIGETMNWKTDCDALILDDDHINIKRADTNESISGASVLASVQNGKVYTIVIRPYDSLGNSSEKIEYKVHLGKSILLDDEANNNPPAFNVQAIGSDYYEWQFTCSTALDTVPPHVQSVFPANKTNEAKNTVIQIDFSEAMDPTTVQGQFNADGKNYYSLDGNTILLKTDNSNVPLGNFNLVNGYRTLEFTSTQECGTNACGNKIYCLPVCDKSGSSCSEDGYELLVKAAKTFNLTSFESIPFSGAMDVSGNALDGNNNNKVDVVTVTGTAFSDFKKPDNYFWSFTLKNVIDNTAPFLKKIAPGLDASYVGAEDPLLLTFSKRMRVDSLYSIGIEQHPPHAIPVCRVPSVNFNDLEGTTLTNILHCPFLQGARTYYLPTVDSAVEDVHYNCFYPGKGPGGRDEVNRRLKESSVCDASGKNCCLVTTSTPGGAFCCNGLVNTGQANLQDCIKAIRSNSF